MNYLPWLAGGAALGYAARREPACHGRRTLDPIVQIPAKALRSGGQEFVLAEWRSFARLSERDKKEWAKTFIGKGIRKPVEVTLHKNGELDIVDGHHRVMAGFVLGLSVPVELYSRLPSSLVAPYLKLLRAGYTPRDINPQRWKLDAIPPKSVVAKGPEASDNWIIQSFLEEA